MSKYKLSVLLEAKDNLSAKMKKIGKVTRDLKKPFGDLKTGLSDLSGRITKVTSRFGLSVGAAYAAVSTLVMKNAEMGDKLAKTADKLGIPIKQLQRYRFAADRSGVATQTFDVAYQRFTRRVADARKGMGPGFKAFQDLQIHLKKSNGESKTTIELFDEVADKIQNIEDPTQRVSAAFGLFDSEGVGMVNMLKDGKKGVNDLGDELEELGGVMSDEAARGSEVLIDKITNLKTAVGGVALQLTGKYQPAIISTIRRVTEWVAKNRELIGTRIEAWIERVSAVGRGFIEVVGGIYNGVMSLIGPFIATVGITGEAGNTFEKFNNVGKALAATLAAMAIMKIAAFFIGIAEAVMMITKAIKALTIAMAKNPLTLLIVAATAALGPTLVDWIDDLFNSDAIDAKRPVVTTPNVQGFQNGKFNGKIVVEMKGAPKGTRITSVEQSGDDGMSIDTGLAFAPQ